MSWRPGAPERGGGKHMSAQCQNKSRCAPLDKQTGGRSMPYATANGIRLAYERAGHGETVLLIMGSSASGSVWALHQVPALTEAGYQAITFDNRGIPPSDAPPGMYSLADMVADTA